MTYENPFLVNFPPVFFGILEAKKLNPGRMELIVFDEEPDSLHVFERADTKDVLYQLGPDLNALTIYTERPEYFLNFVQKMDDEYGLIVTMCSKKQKKSGELMQTASETALVLDFEWEGGSDAAQAGIKCGYIPIHKKPWKVAENLDILVPFGYNTVIVKSKQANDKKFVNDRFVEGFYRDELFYKEG